MIRILKFTLPYFVCFDTTFKFEEVVPAAEDTYDKVESFLAFPEAERSFKFDHSKKVLPLLF